MSVTYRRLDNGGLEEIRSDDSDEVEVEVEAPTPPESDEEEEAEVPVVDEFPGTGASRSKRRTKGEDQTSEST